MSPRTQDICVDGDWLSLDYLIAETMLKSFASGDRMSFQHKFKEPVHATPTAKIMISTNLLPQFADKSMGL